MIRRSNAMDIITVSKRDFTVKAKQLRRSGFVPGSVFGGSLPNAMSLQIDEKAARKLVRSNRELMDSLYLYRLKRKR